MFRKSLVALTMLCMCAVTVGCTMDDSTDRLSSRTEVESVAHKERGTEANKVVEMSEEVGFKSDNEDEEFNIDDEEFDIEDEEPLEDENYNDFEFDYDEKYDDEDEGLVLLDEDGIKVSYLGVSQQSEFQIYDAEYEFRVTNDSDRNINVSIIDVSVDGHYTDTEAHWQVRKNKSVTNTLKFFGLAEKGITDIEELDFAIRVLDTDGLYCLIGYREKSVFT